MSRRLGVALGLVGALAVAGCTSGEVPADADPDAAQAGPDDADEADEADDADVEVEDEQPGFELVAGDTLTVCAEASYPPFEFVDEDSELGYSGFDIELIDAIASRLGIGPITVVEAGFEDIVSGAVLADGTCDVGASAIPITPAREERIDFTDPYYVSRRALVVPSGSSLTSLDDLERGMVLGVQEGTSAADRAAQDAEAGEVRTFADGDALHAALVAGELDAALHDLAIARMWVAAGDDLEVADEFRRIDEFGFATARERSDALLEALNAGLQELQDDGVYDELFEDFFGIDG